MKFNEILLHDIAVIRYRIYIVMNEIQYVQ